MKELKTLDDVLNALKKGKKVVGPGHLRKLCTGGIGCQEQKWYKVLYYYCNPQMNRTFAMLENGMSVDTDIGILDFLYGGFYEYEESDNKVVPTFTKEQMDAVKLFAANSIDSCFNEFSDNEEVAHTFAAILSNVMDNFEKMVGEDK